MYDDFDLDYTYEYSFDLDEDYADAYDLDEDYEHARESTNFQELAYRHYAWYTVRGLQCIQSHTTLHHDWGIMVQDSSALWFAACMIFEEVGMHAHKRL